MFRNNLVTPFQIIMNDFKLDLYINHIIKQFNSRNIVIDTKSYYFNKENVSFLIDNNNLNKFKEIILKKYELASMNRKYAIENKHFYSKYVNEQTFKIKIKRQKIKDNKTFMQNMIRYIFKHFKIPQNRIYGIIGLDSQNPKRLLNLTHYYITKLVSNGLISLDNFDEFFIFVYKKDIYIPNFNLLENNIISNFTNDIFKFYLFKKFSYILNIFDENNSLFFEFVDDTPSKFFTMYSPKKELEDISKIFFLPIHYECNNNIYPYYGYSFISQNMNNSQKYQLPIGLHRFVTGNISSQGNICTGNQNNLTYFGLTTLEAYNANSEYTNLNIILDNFNCDTKDLIDKSFYPIFEFVQHNVKLSLSEYLIEDKENEC